MTANQEIAQAPPAVVAELDEAKGKRFGARTMLIPSPTQVRSAIAQIAFGETRTLKQIRTELAQASGADVTCPRTAFLCWRLVALASDEDVDAGISPTTPWWRVTRDGKPEPRMPGGEERHRALLQQEGIRI